VSTVQLNKRRLHVVLGHMLHGSGKEGVFLYNEPRS